MADVTKIRLPDNSEYNLKDYRIPGVDTTPTSGSDNVVTSGGVYDKINDESLVISTALNDLNNRLLDVEENISKIDETPTEDSTNLVTSGGVYAAIIENEIATASALNDLNDRITTIEDDGIIAEPFSEIDPVSIEYYTKVEIDDLLSEIDVEETDPVFSASPAANITTSDITNWNNKTNNTGTVTQVNVGSTSYNPSNGVVSLPAYPTTLPASDVSAWAKASTKPIYTASEVGAATESYVNTAVSNLVNSAPTTLDTLNELATALGNDPNFATTVATQIGQKQDALVSGTNIKTINNESILGSGNITVNSGNGIDSITTTGDGSFVVNLASGDSITVDLMHSHNQYIKYQYLTSEADYDAIQNKDSNTLYLILDS